MPWEQILEDAVSLIKEKREWAEKIEKAQQSIAEAMVVGDAEKLAEAVRGFTSLVGGGEEVADELANTLKEIPVSDKRMAKSVCSVVLRRSGLLSEATREISKKEEAILRQLTRLVLKGVFGAASATEEDEKAAEQRLRETLEKAQSMDEVIDACRAYIMVKAIRYAQEADFSRVDPEILRATKDEVAGEVRTFYRDRLRKEIDARLKAGKDDSVTAGLFEMWAEAHNGLAVAKAKKVYPILAKTRDWDLVESLLKGR
jgi:hypothetical protein